MTAHSRLVDDRVQLVLERLAADAEQRHELDRILGHVQRLDDQGRRCDVMRAQRTNPVASVTCTH